ncbi:MAG: hypothetical protein U1F53_01845 [Burkholderiaceae bacterium]
MSAPRSRTEEAEAQARESVRLAGPGPCRPRRARRAAAPGSALLANGKPAEALRGSTR